MAERSDALKKAQQKYMERFSVARVRMERDRYELVQAHADAHGESVNGFINRAIDHEMERDATQTPAGAAKEPGAVSYPQRKKKASQEVADYESTEGTQ